MRKLYAVLFLLCASSALAQFTTVSGTVTDPNGLPYANGTIVPVLVTSASPKFTATNQPYTPPAQPIGLSSTGSFVMQLADNTTLTPGATTWNFTVCSGAGTVNPSFGKGSICFGYSTSIPLAANITISGSSQSISTQLNAVAPALTANFGGSGLPAGCSNGQVAQWNGVAWVCATGGTGTVTGTGTALTIPRWSSASGLTDSLLFQNNGFDQTGLAIGLGTPLNTALAFSVNSNITAGIAPNCATGGGPTIPSVNNGFCNSTTIFSQSATAVATGLTSGLEVQNLSNENVVVGILDFAKGNGANTTEIRGLEADAIPSSSGVTTARGVLGYAANTGGTTATNQAFYASTNTATGLGVITNNYSFFADSPVNTGTITHNYGLFVADQSVTATGGTNADPHAIVTAGTAPSSFGGAVTVSGALTANGALTTNITGGGVQCTHVSNTGVLTGTGADCGTGGTGSAVSVNGVSAATPNFNSATPAAANGLNNGTFQVSGSAVSLEIYTNFIDLANGYTSGDPCAYANTVMSGAIVSAGNYFDFGGLIRFFTDGIVPCQSNPWENLVLSGTIDLGPLHFVKSVPWVTPGGNQRVTFTGSGTADVGTTIPAVNTIIQDCGSEAPGWNGTACVVHGITVAAYGATGHSVTFPYPHGAVQAGTYYSSFWLGGMGAAGVNLGGTFGQVVKNFSIWPGAGGGNFGLYVTGAQEQSYCQNVTVRASNDVAIFLDRAQGTATGPSHIQLSGCTGRMDDANTAAQGYPVVGSTAMGYGVWYEGNADVIYFTGGTCTQYPQGYPSTIAAGAISAITMTYAGTCSNLTGLTCHVGSNRGSSATCGFTNSGTTITGITVTAGGTGYSLGDTLGGGFVVENATINGDNTKNMQSAVVLDGCYSCKISQIHTGFDADYGIVIGYGSGAIQGGSFLGNDLENASKGVYHLGNGIDKNQVLLATGKGGSVATITDDACSFSSGTSTAISEYDPCSVYVPAGQAPIYQSGLSVINGGGGSTTFNVTGAGAITATEPTGSVWGGATGGAKGAGTINAKNFYVDGTLVGGSSAWSSLTAPTGAGNFPLAMGSNTSIFTTTTALSQFFAFKNTTTAIVGTSQGSPVLANCGTAFHGSASVESCATWSMLPGNGNDAAIVINHGITGTSTGAVTDQFSGAVAAGAVGTNAGQLVLPGNTTAPAIPANTASFIGPSTASFTAYGLQLPSANPSGGQVLSCGTPSSSVSACTWASSGGLPSAAINTVAVGPQDVPGGSPATMTAVASPSPLYFGDPRAWAYFFDEFICGSSNLGNVAGCLQWSVTGASPTVAGNSSGISNTFGVEDCTTGAVSGNGCGFTLNNGSNAFIYNYHGTSSGNLIYRASLGATTLESFFAGFVNPNSGQGEGTADYVGIAYDTVASDTNFMCVAKTAGTATRTSTGVAADTAMHDFRIRITSADHYSCSIDGGTETAVSTNVPTGATETPQIMLFTRTGSTKVMHVDYAFQSIAITR